MAPVFPCYAAENSLLRVRREFGNLPLSHCCTEVFQATEAPIGSDFAIFPVIVPALYPIADQLGRASGFARDDPPASKLEKLEALLALGAARDEDVALLADLLSLPGSERHPL